jgi:hypothetical protein
MTSDPLAHIYKKLGEHLQAGDEEGAREHLARELKNMPEETRDAIMFELFIDGLQKEVVGREAIAQLQEEGVAAAEILLKAREELENEKEAE